MSCQNNLKQMGLALHNFANTNSGRFPAALINSGRCNVAGGTQGSNYKGPEVDLRAVYGTGTTGANAGQYRVFNHTGFVAMLPYIEQDNLFKQYSYQNISNGSNPYTQTLGPDPTGNPNRIVAAQPIKTYTCPGDTVPAQVVVATDAAGSFYERLAPGVARSNYFFNTAYYTDYDRDWENSAVWARGPFGNNGASSITNMMDGTSNTIAIGEGRQQYRTSTSFGPYWGGGTHTSVHGRILQVTPGLVQQSGGTDITTATNYCAINAPNARLVTPSTTGIAGNYQYAWQFSSVHSGGASFLFCDGSVKFLSNSIDYIKVFQCLATPEGGEVPAGDY